jgi:DNA-directed RNA polymerase subunit RPC12/RpoP
MLPMFPDPLFELFFILSFVLVAVFIAASIYRMLKLGRNAGLSPSDSQAPVKEREIIREVVKIRCSYCGNLYEETEDRCPHCGGKQT